MDLWWTSTDKTVVFADKKGDHRASMDVYFIPVLGQLD